MPQLLFALAAPFCVSLLPSASPLTSSHTTSVSTTKHSPTYCGGIHSLKGPWNGTNLLSVADKWAPDKTFTSDASGSWGCGLTVLLRSLQWLFHYRRAQESSAVQHSHGESVTLCDCHAHRFLKDPMVSINCATDS